ncbi:sodium- and chloride-dependent glycine transporter 1 [Aplysia californica]|uniref:Transporter n=1 Tax=Aplysia californica TaxID=6500 RepID=A0ABM0ZUE7_APLCA|nr:sodium- and chloride-dependent glycine transporter 1 [Aplysia californica]
MTYQMKQDDEKIVVFDTTPTVAASGTAVDDDTDAKKQDLEPSEAGSSVTSIESDDLKERENWTGRLDFLLSCIGFAVGLGNIWRFPYLCYKSGGGAFLVPYIIFLILCGLPLFFMEISYGQFASLSPITVWRISPLFKGIGYGMVIISGIVCVYYNIIITWTFYYLFMSMRKVLPWSVCGQSWNSPDCVVERPVINETEALETTSLFENATFALDNSTSFANSSFVNSSVIVGNMSALVNKTMFSPASQEFWENNVLEKTSGIEDFGGIRWPLFGCLVLAWTIVFLCLCKGVKSSGKVVYVTATFPYLVLLILLVRGVTLPGAAEGIKFYLIPRWEKLATFKVWGDAAVQIFYSVGMAWGSLITMASYNKFSNNVQRDALIVPILNCSTSIFAGLVIFSVLGFMSHTTGVPIDKVVTQGPGLTFVVYPEAVAKMPLSQLWAILFFLMIFTIGLDSQFGMFETMTSAFIDEYPQLLRKKKILFTAFMCFIEFVLGIPIVFQGGAYLLQIMDWYCATFSLMLLSFSECMVISWIYGVDRFLKDIELMIGYKPSVFWKIMWKFVTPAVVLFIWLFSVSQLEPVTYGDYEYPTWAITFGWLLGLCSIIPVPILAIHAIYKEETGTLFQRIRKLVEPAANWGPSQMEDKMRYIESMTSFERERFEAAQQNVDRQRYLVMRNMNSSAIYKGPVTTINLDTAEESAVREQMLPAGAANYPFSAPTEPSHLTNLLNGEKPPNSIC